MLPLRDSHSQIPSCARQGHPDHYRLSLNPGWHPLLKNIGENKKKNKIATHVVELSLESYLPREGGEQGWQVSLLQQHCSSTSSQRDRNGLRQLSGGFAPPDLSIRLGAHWKHSRVNKLYLPSGSSRYRGPPWGGVGASKDLKGCLAEPPADRAPCSEAALISGNREQLLARYCNCS